MNSLSNTECLICWNILDPSKSIILPCNHIFDNSCIQLWKQYNNTCPYCRINLEDDAIIPEVLFDELIAPDGNLDKLTEDNYRKFYRLRHDLFTREHILENIKRIKQARILKESLVLFGQYQVSDTCKHFKGTETGYLIKINQITFDGLFSAWIQTDKKKFAVFPNLIHKLERILF